MINRARELKAEARADRDRAQGESDVLAAILETGPLVLSVNWRRRNQEGG